VFLVLFSRETETLELAKALTRHNAKSLFDLFSGARSFKLPLRQGILGTIAHAWVLKHDCPERFPLVYADSPKTYKAAINNILKAMKRPGSELDILFLSSDSKVLEEAKIVGAFLGECGIGSCLETTNSLSAAVKWAEGATLSQSLAHGKRYGFPRCEAV
jgi:hypothetical protein